jgi:4-amino-4-deoxy-L-arabinose transferase-like glycosyltransferase
MPPTPANADASRTTRAYWPALAAVALLLLGAALHLGYLVRDCPLDLSGDEAHYWEWSRRLDLSYYSKGPLVAYIIAAGRALLADWSQSLVASEALAVRVPAILLSIGTGLGLYVLAWQTLRSSRAALAAVAITFTMPILAVGAFLMTIDAPLALLYVWTLVLVERGLRGRAAWPWVLAGVLIAAGILAKYTMLLVFAAAGLALLLDPDRRRVLRRPAPYVGATLGMLGLVPIVVWNARHDWASFRHVAGQAGLAGGTALHPLGPLNMLASQLGVVGPIWLVAMIAAVAEFWRQPGPLMGEHQTTGAIRFLLAATVAPWLVFGGFSFVTKIQPNWPVLALFPATVLLVAWLRRRMHRGGVARRNVMTIAAAGALTGGAAVAIVHHTEWITPALAWMAHRQPQFMRATPIAAYDPTARLRGWSQLGRAVGAVLAAERAAGREPFIVTDDYQTASEIAFYCPGQPTVYCLQAALGRRRSQYDIWRPNPVEDQGYFEERPCVYVGQRDTLLTGQAGCERCAFPDARLAGIVEHRIRGEPVQIWPIYVCRSYAGLPAGAGTGTDRY